jgi:hypothetical protein
MERANGAGPTLAATPPRWSVCVGARERAAKCTRRREATWHVAGFAGFVGHLARGDCFRRVEKPARHCERSPTPIRDERLAAGVKFWWLARSPRLSGGAASLRRTTHQLEGRRRGSRGKVLSKTRMRGCRSIPSWRVSALRHASDCESTDAREGPRSRRQSDDMKPTFRHHPPAMPNCLALTLRSASTLR